MDILMLCIFFLVAFYFIYLLIRNDRVMSLRLRLLGIYSQRGEMHLFNQLPSYNYMVFSLVPLKRWDIPDDNESSAEV